MTGAWRAAEPTDARAWLAGCAAPWWVAGGWALDLFLGRRTRAHADLDVAVFRDDLPRVREALAGWEFQTAHDGVLARLADGESPGAHVHGLWCRPAGEPRWHLEVMLEARDGGEWVCRRRDDVRLPAERIALRAPDGTPYVRPEVQLLYKAKDPRPRDEEDFRAVAPALDPSARIWLRATLATVHPGHPWLAGL